jgi:hypothetical protein
MRCHPGQVMYPNIQTRGPHLTVRSGSSIMKLFRVFLLSLAVSGTACADAAAQCRAHAGTFLEHSLPHDGVPNGSAKAQSRRLRHRGWCRIAE